MDILLMGFGWILLYFILCIVVLLTIRLTKKVPDEVFRKLLHCILLGSLTVWVYAFPNWWMTCITAIVFAVVVYPILYIAEKTWKRYSATLTERKQGELRQSLVVVFLMFAAVVGVCWGIFGDRLLVLCSVYAWGFGDAAAALIGKRYGRHKLYGKKSVEGTAAMFGVSLICVFGILMLRGGMAWPAAGIIAAVTAMASAAVELLTPGGMDTITCPLAAMTVLLPLVHLVGGGL